VVVGGEGIHKMPQNDKAYLFGCNKEIGAVISMTSHPYPYISVCIDE
jgi:hypothetical protein